MIRINQKSNEFSFSTITGEQIRHIVYEFEDCYYSCDFNINVLAEKYVRYANLLVMNVKQKRAGYIAYYRNDPSSTNAYITMVVVKPEFRKCGIATRMLNEVIRDCKDNHFSDLRLEVDNENDIAKSLYKKMGFEFEKESRSNKSYYRKALE